MAFSAGAAGARSSENPKNYKDLLISVNKKDLEHLPDQFGYCKIPADGLSLTIATIKSAIDTKALCGYFLQSSSQNFDEISVLREFGGSSTLDIIVATHPPSEGCILFNYDR
jgi:hypothetical protein